VATESTAVGVAGAGTMGIGIALLAARHGHRVILYDTNESALATARTKVQRYLDANVERGKLPALDSKRMSNALRPSNELHDFRDCGFCIEAIVEELEAKQALFQRLERVVGKEVPLATNTSSLSVSAIASACLQPERVLGAHFFNPAPIMPLVEIVPAMQSEQPAIDSAAVLLKSWQKITVVAKDTPGFIVNRIARPYYGEALRLLEEGVADAVTIDWAMTEFGRFKMGPFELIDLIGNDVNFAVTRSIFEGLYFDARYRPSLRQQRMVEAKLLGRKTGKGFYEYRDSVAHPQPVKDEELGQAIFLRILSLLINEAVDAVRLGIAAPEEIDLAMTNGVNYPQGLLAWGDTLGLEKVLGEIERLREEYGEDRYRASPLLRRMARSGERFFASSES
jgi:3-hydroxybutyryl-CoA dehydrogenase